MNEIHGYDYQILLKRNQHGGISEDRVRGNVVKRYRASADVKLFKCMDGAQEGAFHEICKAYEMRTAGLGARISKYGDEIRATSGGDMEYGKELLLRYDAWHMACKKAYISALMAIDVIVFGMSLRDTDAKHKFMHGTAKKNLISCLNLW